jgi:hypothetical protein
MLNRAAQIVRLAGPFLEWAAGLDESGLVPDVEGEQTVYLIPTFETEAERRRGLRSVFEAVFENELCGWQTREADWLEQRMLAMFGRWFEIEMHTMIEDLGAGAIADDDEFA